MFVNTPEYVQAHISNLKTDNGSGEAIRHRIEAVARHRRERRERLKQHAATIRQALRFRHAIDEPAQATGDGALRPAEAPPIDGGEVQYLRVGFLAVFLLLASACADSTPTAGPVTIEAQVDFTAQPIVGTFEVTEGADILGCSSGTFVDESVDEFESSFKVNRVMTCDAGSSDGTLTAVLSCSGAFFTCEEDGSWSGPWSVVEASGDFDGLQGAGDWSLVVDNEAQGADTWTGDIEYAL